MAYRLSNAAELDVTLIYIEGFAQFGSDQAESYYVGLQRTVEIISENPTMARERAEFTPPVRIHPYRAHVIIYVVDEQGVLVLRVRHGREDWRGDLI